MKQLFATTARGFEELLKSELTELGAQDAKVAQGGVHYWADDETLYRTLLWSRLSSRILLPIVQAKVFSDLDLYYAVVGVNWLDYFDENRPVNWRSVECDLPSKLHGYHLVAGSVEVQEILPRELEAMSF